MQDSLVELCFFPVSLRRQTAGSGSDNGERGFESFDQFVEYVHSFELVGGVRLGGVVSGNGWKREEERNEYECV